MLFNSIAFIIFFPLVCLAYFLLPYRFRWIFLLIVSYYFYMNWQPMYAILLLGATITTFLCGRCLEKYNYNIEIKKLILLITLLVNLGMLFVFKYYNFINESVLGYRSECSYARIEP